MNLAYPTVDDLVRSGRAFPRPKDAPPTMGVWALHSVRNARAPSGAWDKPDVHELPGSEERYAGCGGAGQWYPAWGCTSDDCCGVDPDSRGGGRSLLARPADLFTAPSAGVHSAQAAPPPSSGSNPLTKLSGVWITPSDVEEADSPREFRDLINVKIKAAGGGSGIGKWDPRFPQSHFDTLKVQVEKGIIIGFHATWDGRKWSVRAVFDESYVEYQGENFEPMRPVDLEPLVLNVEPFMWPRVRFPERTYEDPFVFPDDEPDEEREPDSNTQTSREKTPGDPPGSGYSYYDPACDCWVWEDGGANDWLPEAGGDGITYESEPGDVIFFFSSDLSHGVVYYRALESSRVRSYRWYRPY